MTDVPDIPYISDEGARKQPAVTPESVAALLAGDALTDDQLVGLVVKLNHYEPAGLDKLAELAAYGMRINPRQPTRRQLRAAAEARGVLRIHRGTAGCSTCGRNAEWALPDRDTVRGFCDPCVTALVNRALAFEQRKSSKKKGRR